MSLAGSSKVPFFLLDRVTNEAILSSVIHSSYLRQRAIRRVNVANLTLSKNLITATQHVSISIHHFNTSYYTGGGGGGGVHYTTTLL